MGYAREGLGSSQPLLVLFRLLMRSLKVVTPVKAGVQGIRNELKRLDSGFRRNDRKARFPTFCETISCALTDVIHDAVPAEGFR